MSQTTTDTRSQLLAAVWRLEPVSFYGQGPDRPVERQWRAPDIHATAQEVRTG